MKSRPVRAVRQRDSPSGGDAVGIPNPIAKLQAICTRGDLGDQQSETKISQQHSEPHQFESQIDSVFSESYSKSFEDWLMVVIDIEVEILLRSYLAEGIRQRGIAGKGHSSFILFKMWSVGAVLIGLLLLVLLHSQRNLSRSKRLPPGTMGWPFIGETMQFYSQHPDAFFSSKQKRFGEIVKTHILGCPAVMMASAEAAKLVLVTHSSIFRPTYPPSKMKLIGRNAVFFQHGEFHQRLRHLLQSCFSPEIVRNSVSQVEGLVLDILSSVEGREISAFGEMKKFTFDVGVTLTCGGYEGIDKEEFKNAYHTLETGYNSLPLNLPGTGFNNSMKARKHLSTIVAKLIAHRRASGVSTQDVLGRLIREQLSLDEIADNVIGVIFAAQDTTASVITWVIKYLSGNPSLLADVRAEQDALVASRASDVGGLSCADTKNMPLTSRVVQETLRLASILSFTFRETTEDVEYKGYLIPKGWKVMPLFRNIHHSPGNYPDPYKFYPSRFEKPVKPNTFMPFGNGVHSCLGSELARLEILTLIHHLVTKFRWELLEPKSGLDYRPFPIPKAGLPMRITRRDSY